MAWILRTFACCIGWRMPRMVGLARKVVQLEKVGLVQRDRGLDGAGSRCAALRPAGKRLVQEAEATARAVCVQALERVRVAHVPETVLALAALCQDEALADARS